MGEWGWGVPECSEPSRMLVLPGSAGDLQDPGSTKAAIRLQVVVKYV